ncbi:MAG: xylulokinase [Planctomycetes bacterium]|nr:xylulokinase [Planctomycetota bacterium]
MSAPASLYLGFDIGTQSTKALVIDPARGEVIARAQRSHGLLPDLPPGHMEQHPETWIEAVQATGREVLALVDRERIAGLGVSGQQHGCVVLDADGRVVRAAKLWCDTATADEARWLGDKLGRTVPTGFTASKLVWLQRHEPERWAKVRHVMLPHDFVNFRLTGVASMEFGDASGTGFFDPATRQFDRLAMHAIDARLPSLLPPLLAPGALAGRLSASGANLLGLPEGLPVAAGGGDNMMSAIGSGATRAGVVVVSLGTSGTVFTRTAAPVIDPQGLIAPFCSSDGAWLPLLCVMNLTGVTEEVRALTGLGHGELTEQAAAVPSGCEGLLWLPFLAGERVPDLPEATGTLLGMRPHLLRPGHLYRAALEGTSLNLSAGFDRLRALGVSIDEVRLVGGAAKNPLWQQILANVFGVAVRPLLETESAALGAALQAEWTVRRLGGETDLLTEDVAAPFVRMAAPVVPEARMRTAVAALRARFAAEVERLYPTAR